MFQAAIPIPTECLE